VNLEAMSLGIGAVLVAGFDDSKVQDALHLPEELEPTALLCIGAGK
jgi:nitroreductase